MRNYDDERLAAFMFTERFFGLLLYREQMALYLFRYYIFRNRFSRSMMQFLFEGTGRKGDLPRQPLGTAGRFPAGKDSGRGGPQALRQRNLRLPDTGDAQRGV